MVRRVLSTVMSVVVIFLAATSLSDASERSTSRSAVEQVDAGNRYFGQGRFSDALAAWSMALDDYRAAGDTEGQARVLQHKAEAYLAIGHYYEAIRSLKSALALAEASQNEVLATQVAATLGNAYLLSNHMDEARELLEKAVTKQRSDGRLSSAAVAGTNLGNLLASQGEFEAAIRVFQHAMSDAQAAGNDELATKGAVNIARVLVDSKRQDEARPQLGRATKLAESLSPSHGKAYALISIGRLYAGLADDTEGSAAGLAERALNEAATVAASIHDDRALSYAYGYLGALYEHAGRNDEAMEYTRKASAQLHATPAPEIRYRWQWQEGRLLRAAGDSEGAIRAYQRAVDDLQVIRPILAAGHAGGHGDFRQGAGRLYLELADLLLNKADTLAEPRAVQADLRSVRTTVEMLKGAELEDYFRDDCVAALKAKATEIDQLGAHTAAIYPIVLPDHLEILLSLPDGIRRYRVPVGAEQLNNEINRFRALLEKRITNQYRRPAYKIYGWLIQPLEKDLEAQKIDTLVVIPDGPLRTIPLAALYDGKDFLINRYAMATTPGLTLTDPKPLPRQNVQVLVAGLTEGVQGFPPLPDVSEEVTKLDQLYSGAVLENSTFTLSNVEQQLVETPFSIVHVASHGQFESDVRKTFLLTYDSKLNMDTLKDYMSRTTYRQQPVELLTLSACQTAVGDDQAALGLAGVAVKAGARSALATLWYINDEASSLLITRFYANLKDSTLSKARALQKAQLTLLADPRFHHPSYWAPFLLIGNWL